ncbi:MAG: hypothetical protein CR982_06095 [Candidatus Cloacimonadota bacterium]|nr:MAG: hypothetical protein CR982_06095 [Candidatus Cloacimonadota bacterium]PIE78091.1 MAG: hypothetical protein CSA15_09655 [Candidatus Delongbacteria bacterium]
MVNFKFNNKKKELFLILISLAVLLIFSCEENRKQKSNSLEKNETVSVSNENIVKELFVDKNGNKLNITFNNTKGIATIYFKGEKAELKEERSASGIWYTNKNFDLSGKGNDITLKKDGNIVFEHYDDIVRIESKNEAGEKLNLVFNNSQGTVKAYLNGGEQIDMKEKRAASGIWYTNEHYELSGKGDKYKLRKDGVIIFEN